jgi:hypothetical protein
VLRRSASFPRIFTPKYQTPSLKPVAMPNHLALETSPYLLQHRDNPVDWYPWCAEALELAVEQQKPIFLSVGYSACHWCHVMAHESFEDEQISRLLNGHFISVKVDREERPDLDQIYMNAVQLLSGRGGWPMSVFLTPGLEPFFGGTYWPPSGRMGMPGFDQVLEAVIEAWRERREQALAQGAELAAHIRQARLEGPADGTSNGELSSGLLRQAGTALERQFDPRHGGFGGAPKFPHPLDLQLLLRLGRQPHGKAMLEMVVKSLDMMAAGGIYDHLGGGFHRYSVDERWLVPHFEKMLYDNALLATCYLEGFLATGRPEYARVVGETLEYILRDMTDPAGGLYSAEDADSEGEEGKFYVWTADEIAAALGPEAAASFGYVYDVSQAGNFEAANILNRPKTIQQCAALHGQDPATLDAELTGSRKKLLAARNGRVRPGRDDKVLVAWNALAIDALARAAGALDQPRWLAAAQRAANFILRQIRGDDDRLLHTWRAGQAKVPAFLDDYAALVNSLVTLYEASFDERWIAEAVRLADTLLARFADPAAGGFFFTADDQPAPLGRQKEWQDSATPSGNSLAAMALLRLGKLTGRATYLESAIATLRAATGLMARFPTAASQMLLALDTYLGPTPEIVILGKPAEADTQAVLADLRHRFLPNKVVAMRSPASHEQGSTTHIPALDPLFAGKTATRLPTVFVCENFTCAAPLSGKESVLTAWAQLSGTADAT